MANPFLFLAPLNGTLAFQDRAGGGTLTGSGAVRYAAASGARWNLWPNPYMISAASGYGGEMATATDATGLSSEVCPGTSTALKMTSSAGAAAAQYWGASLLYTSANRLKAAPISASTQYTVSAYVWHDAGFDVEMELQAETRKASTDNITSAAFSRSIVPTETLTQMSLTFTSVAEDSERLCVSFYGLEYNGNTLSEGIILYASGVQVETGASVTELVSGSNGGVWLDPRTGILGTANASPSVSKAAAWVEEATTNTVPDPSFEAATITTNWSAINVATISKVTSHSYIGSNSGKVSCTATTSDGIGQLSSSGAAASTGQSWTLSGRIRAFASGDVGKSIVPCIAERDVSNALVLNNAGTPIVITSAWQYFSYTVTLSGGGTVTKTTCRFLNGAASAVDFVLDCVQLEQKAYATSYCDGAIGTGYAWSGTAHASSSTRTATTIIVNETNRISSSRGATVMRVNRLVSTSARQHVFNAGLAGAGTDYLMLYIEAGAGTQRADWRINNGGAEQVNWGSVNAVNTSNLWISDWDGTAIGITLDAGTRVAATRTAPTTLENASKEMYIASSNTGGSQINGLIGPVAIFDRPLKTKERSRIYNTSSLTWNLLRSGFRHRKIV